MPPVNNTNKAPDAVGLQHYLQILSRRRLLFVVPLFLGWLAVWGASWILPPRYKSSTLILVEQPTMPRDYVLPNISENLQERLQSISQQILSRSRLLHIVEEMKLYPENQVQRSPDEIVDSMRKNIDIEGRAGTPASCSPTRSAAANACPRTARSFPPAAAPTWAPAVTTPRTRRRSRSRTG